MGAEVERKAIGPLFYDQSRATTMAGGALEGEIGAIRDHSPGAVHFQDPGFGDNRGQGLSNEPGDQATTSSSSAPRWVARDWASHCV